MFVRTALGTELYEDLAPLVDTWGDPPLASSHLALAKDFGAYLLLRLGEDSGVTAADEMGNDPGTYFNVTLGQPSLYGDKNTAALFSGASNSEVMTSVGQGPTNLNTLSLDVRFQTTTTSGGVLIQLGNTGTIGASPTNYDRMIYMSNDGKLHFGMYSAGFYIADSTAAYNDGLPHSALGVLSNGNVYLYVDGALVGSNTTGNGRTPDSHSSTDYWRIGRGEVGSWPSAPTNKSFTGVIDEPTVYYVALTADQASDISSGVGSLGDLEIFCQALGAMMQPVDDICKDGPNGEPGWSQVLDLVRAKDEWLPWLGQWVGYLVPEIASGESPGARSIRERGRIVSRASNRRATIALLREIIQEHLSGNKTVYIQERTGDAHTINVWVLNSEIATSTALVTAAAQAAKAYGLIMVFTVLTGANYNLLQASNASYTIMTGKHANYNSVLTNPGL